MPPDTSDPVHIRPATGADVPALVFLLGLLFAQEADFSPDATRQESALKQIIEAPDSGILFVAADMDGAIVGMVSLLFSISTATGGRAAWLEDMIVAPQTRQQGIGSRLLRHAIDWAQAHDMTRLTLLTDTDNIRAQHFYRSHGFQPSAMTTLRLPLTNE